MSLPRLAEPRPNRSERLYAELSELGWLEVDKARDQTRDTAHECEVLIVVRVKAGEIEKEHSHVKPAKRQPW